MNYLAILFTIFLIFYVYRTCHFAREKSIGKTAKYILWKIHVFGSLAFLMLNILISIAMGYFVGGTSMAVIVMFLGIASFWYYFSTSSILLKSAKQSKINNYKIYVYLSWFLVGLFLFLFLKFISETG